MLPNAFRPTLWEGLVIVGTRGFLGENRSGPLGAGSITALSRATGEVRWRIPLPDAAGFPFSGGATQSGIVVDGVLVLGTQAGTVLGIRPDDGSIIWSQTGGAPNQVRYDRSPVALDGLAIHVRGDGTIEARRPADGAAVWSERVSTTGPTGDPLTWNGRMYYAHGPIRAFNSDGTRYLESRGPYPDFGFFGAITVTDDGSILANGEQGGGVLRARYLLLRTER